MQFETRLIVARLNKTREMDALLEALRDVCQSDSKGLDGREWILEV